MKLLYTTSETHIKLKKKKREKFLFQCLFDFLITWNISTAKNTINYGHLLQIIRTEIGSSGPGKTNALLNLVKQHNDIDKIYLNAKDSNETNYELSIKKREDAGTKHLNDSNAFIECSNTTGDVYENIVDYNPNRKRKILIVFDDILQIFWQTNFKP